MTRKGSTAATNAIRAAVFGMLAIVSPLDAVPIGPSNLMIAPQEWTITWPWTITITVRIDGAEPPDVPSPPEEIVETNCVDLMASYNAAAGQADPYERTTEGEFEGGAVTAGAHNMGCQIQMGVPAR